MDAIERALRDEENAAKRLKNSEQHRARETNIGYEMRASGSITATGKHRRHILGRRADEGMLSVLMKSPLAAWLIAAPPPGNTEGNSSALRALWDKIYHPSTTRQPQQIEICEGNENSYIYDTLMVSPVVKKQLDDTLLHLQVLEIERDALYDAVPEGHQLYGPTGADYRIYKFMEDQAIRIIPGTNQKAFCEIKVQEMEAQAGPCVGDACPVPVYKTVPTESLTSRGIHVRAADPNSQDDVKAAASEVAEVKAAILVPVPPAPQ